ncbi:condensin-2 complex subunit G2 [Lampetra fluviatilis]
MAASKGKATAAAATRPARDAFLQSLKEESPSRLLEIVERHKSRTDPFCLKEVLEELPLRALKDALESIGKILTESLLRCPAEQWNPDPPQHDDMETEATGSESTVAVVTAVATVLSLAVKTVSAEVIEYILESAIILHALLPLFTDSHPNLRNTVINLCESWWERDLPGKEELGKNMILTILRCNLIQQSKTLGAGIKRLWSLRESFRLFDFLGNPPETEELKELLLQGCIVTNIYLKTEESRRFLSFLFGLNVDFIKSIHAVLKKHLPSLTKVQVGYYADIYFQAWKKATGPYLKVMEEHCIQNLMEHGVYLPYSSPLNSKVRQMLSYFHAQKVRQGVDEMLHRLYEPILWRALKASNSEIRANATLLFTDAFPLQDPAFGREEADADLQRQFEELFRVLDDPCPRVRSSAVLGVCRLTSRYWEMIPGRPLSELLTKLVSSLAFDASSADVRCAVYKSLPIVLDNKLSHPLMEKLLPEARNGLHDVTERVRVAFVDMLLKVKAVRAAKYWKICPMEHLLARLAMDSPVVTRRLVQLLASSFLPVEQPEETWSERCITLVQMNPTATRCFYQHLHKFVSPTNIAKLILQLYHCLNTCLPKHKGQNEEKEAEGDEKENESQEDDDDDEDVPLAKDLTTVGSLLEVVVILWSSIRKVLLGNPRVYQQLVIKFSDVVPGYFRTFKNERCYQALVILASYMPPNTIPTFSGSVLSRLRAFELGVDDMDFTPLLDCMCCWGQAGHILELITEWLSANLGQKSPQTRVNRVRISVPMLPKPDLALQYTEYMLRSPVCCASVLDSGHKLNALAELLATSKDTLRAFLKNPKTLGVDTASAMALRAFRLHCLLQILIHHKHNGEGRAIQASFESTSSWVVQYVLCALQAPHDTASNKAEAQASFALDIATVYLKACKDIVLVGLADPDFIGHCLEFTISVVETDKGVQCLPLGLQLLQSVLRHCLCQDHEDATEVPGASTVGKNAKARVTRARSRAEPVVDAAARSAIAASQEKLRELVQVAPTVFQKLLQMMGRCTRKQADVAQQVLLELGPALAGLLAIVCQWRAFQESLFHDIVSITMVAVVAETKNIVQKNMAESTPVLLEKLSNTPPLSACILATVLRNDKITRSFLSELEEFVHSDELQSLVDITSVLHIIHTIFKAKGRGRDIGSVAKAIQNQLDINATSMMDESSTVNRVLYEEDRRILSILLPSQPLAAHTQG